VSKLPTLRLLEQLINQTYITS